VVLNELNHPIQNEVHQDEGDSGFNLTCSEDGNETSSESDLDDDDKDEDYSPDQIIEELESDHDKDELDDDFNPDLDNKEFEEGQVDVVFENVVTKNKVYSMTILILKT